MTFEDILVLDKYPNKVDIIFNNKVYYNANIVRRENNGLFIVTYDSKVLFLKKEDNVIFRVK